MDGYEATRIVMSRIQNIDPKNASKIMGLLLIQDHGEKEMIRLAFGPESLVHSVILKAKKELGLSSPTSSSSSPSSPSPLFSSNPISISTQNSSSFSSSSSSSSTSSSRVGFNVPPSLTIPNPPSNSSSSWSAISEVPNHPDDLISPSNGSSLNPSSLPFYANGSSGGGSGDLVDEYQLQDQMSFLNDNSLNLGPKSNDLFYPQVDSLPSPTGAAPDSMLFPPYWGGSVHRRSCSVNDVLGAEDLNSGLGWRPCVYYSRGFCKNGSNCRFIHGGFGESEGTNLVGSPNNKVELMDQCHEMLRSKSHLMNFLLQQQQNDSQRATAAALMMGEEMQKFGRSRLDRNDLINPASRQIYLTFPADSTFREEDVSNYFSIYGPVQDVRIPYQQKRMFGFVTFVYPETVKIILAKGNPHFVCDARVLVKPYKEKGKVPDKKQQQQQVERGDFSPCGTPTGLESRDPFDLQLGSRVFYNAQDMLWRRKLEEQVDLRQALELQNRRLMGLQLLDVKKQHHHRALSTGSPIPSPTHSPNLFSQSVAFPPLRGTTELAPENCSSPVPPVSITSLEKQIAAPAKESAGSEENGSGKENSRGENNDLLESLEHNLPDSPFASPAKGSVDYFSAFSTNGASEVNKDATIPASSSTNNNLVTSTLIPANASRDMTSFKSFNCQLPRFSSGHGAIGMYTTGTGGPTYPVGI